MNNQNTWYINKIYCDNDQLSFGPVDFKTACQHAKDLYGPGTKSINISKQKKGRTL